MAEIIQNESQGGGKKKRVKKHGTHIDMTPMVDLACLLLTFFMLTTAFNKPKVMQIILPEERNKDDIAPEINENRALNIILVGNDRILWYNGMADPQKPPLPTLNETDYSKDGIRKLLLQRNKELFKKVALFKKDVIEGKIALPQDSVESRILELGREDAVGPIVLFKATDEAKYRNFVDIMDEMVITNVVRRTFVDINPVEKMMVRNYLISHPSVAASN